MPSLLVVDDDPLVRALFHHFTKEGEIALRVAGTGVEALDSFAKDPPDAVILDLLLPDMNGLDVFQRIQAHDARIPVIFLTASGDADVAIEAIKQGAFDYQIKPVDVPKILELVERSVKISRMSRVPVSLAPTERVLGAEDALIGASQAMQQVYKAIGRVAAQDITVLILGESGTGKELVARAIYHHSRRSDKPFVPISCAAIPETLLESELFGHEKGAFTGADHKRIGKFEQASNGTLFLDEIGDMTPFTQSKLLRVLQDQQFERLGGNETIRTNTRLIAATSRDLDHVAAAGQFRQDLYYRLSVFTIRLPPLRQRLEDLPALAEHLTKRFNQDFGKDIRRIAPETLDVLRRHSWPGNVRELQSVLKQAILQASGTVLIPDFLPPQFNRPVETTTGASAHSAAGWEHFIAERLDAGVQNLHQQVIEAVERELLVRALQHTAGNQARAARMLGITRRSLRTKIQALGITLDHSVGFTDDQPRSKGTA